MDCQGAEEEPEGRPGGPGVLETARGGLGLGLGHDLGPGLGLGLGSPLALLPLTGPDLPSGASWGTWQSIKLS